MKRIIFLIVAAMLFYIGVSTGDAQTIPLIHLSYEVSSPSSNAYSLRAGNPITPAAEVTFFAKLFLRQRDGNITLLDPSNYTFRWVLNDQVFLNRAERGLHIMPTSLPRRDEGSHSIRVIVSDRADRRLTSQIFSIPIQQPTVSLFGWTDNGLREISSNAFRARPGQLLTIVAQPFFFGRPQNGELNISWLHGNQPIQREETDNPLTLTLRIRPDFPSGHIERFAFRIQPLFLGDRGYTKNFSVEIE